MKIASERFTYDPYAYLGFRNEDKNIAFCRNQIKERLLPLGIKIPPSFQTIIISLHTTAVENCCGLNINRYGKHVAFRVDDGYVYGYLYADIDFYFMKNNIPIGTYYLEFEFHE